MKRITLISILLSTILFADTTDKGIESYNNEDYKKAIFYFKEAANNNGIMAQYRLALMYEKGRGTMADYEKSIYWHQIAAKNGHAISQYTIAEKYYNGIFFKKNIKKAVYWYQKSAAQRYPSAQYKLALLYIKGIDVLKDYTKAKFWMSESYNNGSLLAKLAWNEYELWKY